MQNKYKVTFASPLILFDPSVDFEANDIRVIAKPQETTCNVSNV